MSFWEVWNYVQSTKLWEGDAPTPGLAYRAYCDSLATSSEPESEDPGSWDEDTEPGYFSVNIRERESGHWFAFVGDWGEDWARTPDLAAIRAETSVDVTDAYGFISAEAGPSAEELERRQGIQWYVDRYLATQGQEHLSRCVTHPECAGNAILARACWVENRAKLAAWKPKPGTWRYAGTR